jgi:hypothetical protein
VLPGTPNRAAPARDDAAVERGAEHTTPLLLGLRHGQRHRPSEFAAAPRTAEVGARLMVTSEELAAAVADPTEPHTFVMPGPYADDAQPIPRKSAPGGRFSVCQPSTLVASCGVPTGFDSGEPRWRR